MIFVVKPWWIMVVGPGFWVSLRPSRALPKANILAGPLIELAPVLLASLRPGGSLVLSGILEEQAEEVVGAYRHHIDDLITTVDDGWVRLSTQGDSQ